MAKAKFGTVTKTIKFNDDCQLVQLEIDPEDFNYAGGKYIIINSQVPLDNGKWAKRAYSIIAKEDKEVTLAALQLGDGPGSCFMNQLKSEDSVEFSGPWGKLMTKEDAQRHFILATDTGISAALGLVNGDDLKEQLDKTAFCWLRPSDNIYLSDSFVRESLPEGLSRADIMDLAPINSDERMDALTGIALPNPEGNDHFYLVGDGHVTMKLREDLINKGYKSEQISSELFFNKPVKS